MMVTRQGLTAQRETVKWAELIGPVVVSLVLSVAAAGGSVYVSSQIQGEKIAQLERRDLQHDASLDAIAAKLDALIQSNARIEGYLRLKGWGQ